MYSINLAAIPGFEGCESMVKLMNIDENTIGPNGQPLVHPSFPHPLSCQKYITCYFLTDIKELGCMKGQVFDYTTQNCSDPEVGPEDW